jgi:hypothetical protein
MSKFKCGQCVFLFNSLSVKIEEDVVYGALFVPVAVEGVKQDSGASLSEKLDKGQMEVKEQYQLVGHQGIIDAEVLFASEDECRKFYAEFFK